MEHGQTHDDIATVSDEALALLALENSIAQWDDVWTKLEGNIRTFRRNEVYPPEWMSTVPMLYTVPATADAENGTETMDKRWSAAGITRFNDLRGRIIADRTTHNTLFATWLAEQRENSAATAPTAAASASQRVDASDDFVLVTPAATEQVLNNDTANTNAVDTSEGANPWVSGKFSRFV